MVGASGPSFGNDVRKDFCQRPQISGEVTTKVRKGLPGRSLLMRGKRVGRRLEPMVTA